MKKEYEMKIETDGTYINYNSDYDKKEGWEVEKQEVITKKGGFFQSDELVNVYHLKRDITPKEITITVKVKVPAWKITHKQVDDNDFYDNLKKELIKTGLAKKDEDE